MWGPLALSLGEVSQPGVHERLGLARLRRLREALGHADLDGLVLVSNENILYATGGNLTIVPRLFGPVGAAVVTPGDAVAIVPADEFERVVEEVEASGSGARVLPYDLGASLDEILAQQIVSLGLDDARLGFEEGRVSFGFQNRVQRLVPKARWKDASSAVWAARRVKLPGEVEAVRLACRCVLHGLVAAVEAIRPGVSEAEVLARAEAAMRRGGATAHGSVGLVCSGERTRFAHAPTRDRPLARGDVVNINLHVSVNHYFADVARLVFVGRVSDDSIREAHLIREWHQQLLHATRGGTRVEDIARPVVDAFLRQQIPLVHGLGRGVGLELVEPPFVVPGSSDTLEAGMVISYNPWYARGGRGWKLVDTVLVTEDGCEVLTFWPLEPIVR